MSLSSKLPAGLNSWFCCYFSSDSLNSYYGKKNIFLISVLVVNHLCTTCSIWILFSCFYWAKAWSAFPHIQIYILLLLSYCSKLTLSPKYLMTQKSGQTFK